LNKLKVKFDSRTPVWYPYRKNMRYLSYLALAAVLALSTAPQAFATIESKAHHQTLAKGASSKSHNKHSSAKSKKHHSSKSRHGHAPSHASGPNVHA
jgi:hypothetical protein